MTKKQYDKMVLNAALRIDRKLQKSEDPDDTDLLVELVRDEADTIVDAVAADKLPQLLAYATDPYALDNLLGHRWADRGYTYDDFEEALRDYARQAVVGDILGQLDVESDEEYSDRLEEDADEAADRERAYRGGQRR